MKRREDIDTEADLCSFCYPREERNILYEDEDVYVMPCLGSFVEGYLLVVNKDHEDSFGDLMDQNRSDVFDMVRNVVEKKYGDCCFFEHGEVGSCLKRAESKICYHAHMHCLPIPSDITSLVREDFEPIFMEDLTELKQLKSENPHYLFIEDAEGRKKFFPVEDTVESQYLRKKACESVGKDRKFANWREHEFRDKMQRTAGKLRGEF